MEREQFGILAKGLRVKITRDPRTTTSGWTVLPGQIGFKQKDGSYFNAWVDVWVSPDRPLPKPVSKGDVVFVTGKFNMGERTYNDVTRTEYSIWCDQITFGQNQQQPQYQGQGNQTQPPQRQGQFPSEASGMDDVPF